MIFVILYKIVILYMYIIYFFIENKMYNVHNERNVKNLYKKLAYIEKFPKMYDYVHSTFSKFKFKILNFAGFEF